MLDFNEEVIKNEYDSYNDEKQKCLDDIKNIVIESKGSLEGNSFYIHDSLDLFPDLYTKQLNLFWCGKQANIRICEIGFNAGHSTLLMLLGRDKLSIDFTIFDLGMHKYTKPCFEYIQSKFPHIRFEFIEGDSTVTIPKWIDDKYSGLYDVVHVDGGHSEHCIKNDMKHADILVKNNGIVIIDDTNCDYINKTVDAYLSTGNYIELNVLKTQGYPHRIIRKIVTHEYMYVFLLKEGGKITYVFYDIKEALEKAILLNLELIRLRMRGEGRVSEMLIYSPK